MKVVRLHSIHDIGFEPLMRISNHVSSPLVHCTKKYNRQSNIIQPVEKQGE